MTIIYKLPCFGIVVECSDNSKGGTITSDLLKEYDDPKGRDYCAAVNAVESMILAHACAGVNVLSPGYVEGIETAMEQVFNVYT